MLTPMLLIFRQRFDAADFDKLLFRHLFYAMMLITLRFSLFFATPLRYAFHITFLLLILLRHYIALL